MSRSRKKPSGEMALPPDQDHTKELAVRITLHM
jgi:hypothetical protein